MVNTGLLIITNPAKVSKLLPVISKHVLKTLYIQYFPEKYIIPTNAYSKPIKKLEGSRYSEIVSKIYTLAVSHYNCLDVRVLLFGLKNPKESIIYTKKPIELVIFDQNYSRNDAKTFMQDCLSNTSMNCEFLTFDDKDFDDSFKYECSSSVDTDEKMYKNVVLGGTFDRLHIGHKIILSQAILRCTENLTIGVTEEIMLCKKILWELIEPCSKRISMLNDFVQDVDPSLKYGIIPITDLYGPTKEDPNFELLIVSEETKKGGDLINEKRTENNLKKLDVYTVKLIKDLYCKNHEESKISSSNERMRMLGTRLKKPNVSGKTIKPYLIGLTGGIASGKSSIADKLQKLGAGLINCDFIAHSLYAPGMKCYNSIIETFGTEYLNNDGQINRKALGNFVFNNKQELEKLNKILWPEILNETKQKISELHKNGYNVVVVEAAVLIQAKWQSIFHEIWTCIIPLEEAVKRLVTRNKFTEEEAKKRIFVQPSNIEQVENSHVVVSTMWSHEITQQQVEKAWNEVMKDLAEK